MADVIQSVSNPRVKLWASLMERKHREREGKFLVEGVHLVQEAILSGATVETVVYSEVRGLPGELQSLVGNVPEVVVVSEDVMVKCSDTVTPQGVFAVVRKSVIDAERILQYHRSLVVAVDGVQDPGNLGTIIRSADAVGASAVLLGKGTVDLYNAKTIRSTMGSMFHLPIAECVLSQVLPAARASGVQVVASRLQDSLSCYMADYRRDTWFIVGNEGKGVSEEVGRLADTYVKIPMPGHAESLNVAMAATVLLFEAMRQRLGV